MIKRFATISLCWPTSCLRDRKLGRKKETSAALIKIFSCFSLIESGAFKLSQLHTSLVYRQSYFRQASSDTRGESNLAKFVRLPQNYSALRQPCPQDSASRSDGRPAPPPASRSRAQDSSLGEGPATSGSLFSSSERQLVLVLAWQCKFTEAR